MNVLPQAAPHTDWRRLVEAKREQYSEFKQQHYPDFDKVRRRGSEPEGGRCISR